MWVQSAFVASTSPILTKFYLLVIYQRTTQELMDGLAVSMKDALKEYYQNNYCLPEKRRWWYVDELRLKKLDRLLTMKEEYRYEHELYISPEGINKPWTNIFKRRYNQFQEHQETNRLRKIVAKVLKRYPHLRDDEERLLEEYLKTL
ncbi:unnamed protein product [Rotaria sp. Silwood1]|nr:unnamed protein product [Rotaria sp. Silwood1]CAF1620856.1 unnamed protein product [Rotaria sp. Silwood1]CAF3817478.1 unnamed protein product [Rotaria sp. Silwood1]